MDQVRNKLWLHIILFSIGFSMSASAITNVQSTTVKSADSFQTDTSTIEPRHFDDLNDTYSGNEFIYERTAENAGWWTRFKRWLSDKINDLFDFNSDAKASSFTDAALTTFYIIILLLV